MKDSLRKEIPQVEEAMSVTSMSTENSANPWSTELSGPKSITEQSQSSQSSVVAANGAAPAVPEVPKNPNRIAAPVSIVVPVIGGKTRRKKTVVKDVPAGTFELKEDSLKKQTTNDSSTKAEQKKPSAPVVLEQPPRPSERNESPQSQPTSPAPVSRVTSAQAQPPSSNPFTTAHRRAKSSQVSRSSLPLGTLRLHPPTTTGFFFQKVIVISSGISPIGTHLVRLFHNAGARVIFGFQPDFKSAISSPVSPVASPLQATTQAGELIRSLGPPHTAHSNPCDIHQTSDLLSLFKLARTMYGRVDHAIFLADDGSSKTLADRERGWLKHSTTIEDLERGEHPSSDLAGTMAAAVRFAHIAVPYFRHSPKSARRRYTLESNPNESTKDREDKSLTFISSIAGITATHGLPVHSALQHSIVGLVRSLRTSLTPESTNNPNVPTNITIRANAVCPGMLIPRTLSAVGGRMSVAMPRDEPEDVSRIVVGVVAASGDMSSKSTQQTSSQFHDALETAAAEGNESSTVKSINAQNPWDDGKTSALHGKILYMLGGGQVWDVDAGLSMSEGMWLGQKGAEAVRASRSGFSGDSTGGESTWILDIG